MFNNASRLEQLKQSLHPRKQQALARQQQQRHQQQQAVC
jgi:hypothetical protein